MSKEMPKIYEPDKYEDKIYKEWEDSGYFRPETGQPLADNLDNLVLDKNTKPYTIVLPPPNVTGTLHMGHAGMLAYEDILIRYHRMKGDKTLWLPGTDHAAIATQTKVEKIIKKEGTNRHKMGKEKFLERVRQYAIDSHDTIVNQCKKIGASLDWSREAYTLDKTRNKAVNSVFKLMYDDGLIYRGERIVNWCPRCRSVLADDEVEYKEKKAVLYYFKYDKNFPITIATTRPETKLGDTAVAINPKDERYKKYIGKNYNVNFCGVDLKIKIIADRHIDMEFGTGALGVTPAHSMVDWQMAEENNLEIKKVINEEGNIHNGFNEFSGLNVYEARKKIIKKLKAQNLVEKEEEISNNLSICYRCDTPIEPLPSLQWFINVNKKIERLAGKSIKEICIKAVKKGVFGRDKIKIIPKRFEKSYFGWMDNLRDWCISRQILFGHQVPVWYKNHATHSTQCATDNKENIYVGIEPPEGDGWTQDEDTLDTWFSSGMWTFSTLANSPDQIKIEDGKLVIDSDDFRNFHPTQVLETGYDILFFWVARMIIMTTYAINDIPFEDVYLHGLVLDDKGKKMSKSKGNVIDPLDMIKKYGTDATRLSLIVGSSPGNDIRISEEKIAGYRNLVNKLWNISRYILSNIEELEISDKIDFEKLSLADKWIVFKLNKLTVKITKDIENYQFSLAGERLREFTWNDLADWYLEATKFIKSEETEKILLIILRNLLKLWHPFIPFVTEVIWKEFNKTNLIIEKWPSAVLANSFRQDYGEVNKQEFFQEQGLELLKGVVSAIRNARAENNIEPSKKIKAVIRAGKHVKLIKENEAIIKGMRTGISELEIKKTGNDVEDAIKVVVGDIIIYLVGAIDKEKEKKRIQKRKDELKKVIKNIKSKFDNKNFVERAPKAVVKKEKDRLSKFEKELKKLIK